MLSPWVVEHLDVIEYDLSRLFARFASPALYPLTLEQVEEALSVDIVMTVSAAAHRVLEIVSFQERRPVQAGELGALIGLVSTLFLGLRLQTATKRACRTTFVV